MQTLLKKIKACDICAAHLPHGVNPVMAASSSSKVVIIGQAPGSKVHKTNIPWNDPSGDLLRIWMGVNKTTFYDASQIALMPMGFCYPGKGKSGDLPPRPECAPQWHQALLEKMPDVELIILIGQYSQKHYLGKKAKINLTETVKSYRDYLPRIFPLPHPSPRNRIWLKKNPWFDSEVVPAFRQLLGNWIRQDKV